jgi:hypothetical protein
MAATCYAMMMVRHAKTQTQVRDWNMPIQYPKGHVSHSIV